MPRVDQRPLLSIALMLGATTSFVGMQTVVKLARQHGMDTTDIMLYRTAPGLPVLWWSLRRRGLGLLPEEPGDVVVRSLLGTLAMGTNFAALTWLSLAQFSTLGLSNPVFVALVAPWLLREKPKAHRWIAMPLGLGGALVLLAPALGSRSVPAIAAALGLASALFSAFAQIWVRKATANDPAERVVFHFAAIVSVLSLLYGLASGHFRALPPGLSPASFVLSVASMAGFGTLGQVLMTRAYSQGEASTVSLVAYAGILLSMLADLAFWHVLPAPSAVLGAGLMVAAGFVLVRGERR